MGLFVFSVLKVLNGGEKRWVHLIKKKKNQTHILKNLEIESWCQ